MAEELTKMQKFKRWCSDNSDMLAFTSVFGTLIAGTVALVIVDLKDQKKRIEAYNAWAKDQNNWLNEQQNDGKTVYQLEDGRFLVVPQDAPQETVIR